MQHYANMLWLDSSYPTDQAGQPGADRGDCPTTSGVPTDVESSLANAQGEFIPPPVTLWAKDMW